MRSHSLRRDPPFVDSFVWWFSILLVVTILSSNTLAAQVHRPARLPLRLVVTHDPATIVIGAPFALDVQSGEYLDSLKGSWLGREIFFAYVEERRRWIGLAGAALDTATGSHPLILKGSTKKGVEFTQAITLDVVRASYHSSALTVSRSFTEPDAATSERIAREQKIKKEMFAGLTPDRQWSGSFTAPIDSVTTEPFGTQRTFNGAVQSVHQGLDYRASLGTPVRAVNSGTVLLAQELFFEGNCVVIDHGQGLLSLYFHLSALELKEADQVSKGQVIGLSGATGRVTAPHLHLAIRWQGVYLDPARLLKLTLP